MKCGARPILWMIIVASVTSSGVAQSPPVPLGPQPAPASPTEPAPADAPGSRSLRPSELRVENPLVVLEDAAESLPGFDGGLSSAINVMILLTVLALAPSIMILTTCFMRILIVLALLRQALGTQGLPPSQVLTGLALFLTFMVMAPTFQRINEVALMPLSAGEINQMDAWSRARQPLRDFMFAQIEKTGNWSSVYMIMRFRGVDMSQPEVLRRRDVDMLTLVPSFILSELKTSFLIGFRVYLPFLIVDMVIASILISMGMFMLPPVLISLPFKLLLFVLVDGWQLIAGSLLDGFAVPVFGGT